jgi:hypothetical protein
MAISTPSREKAVTLRKNSQARVAQIRNDVTLTKEQKTALIAREYQRHSAELRPLKDEHDAQVAGEQSRLEHAVFGFDDNADAYRQALAQAATIDTQEHALRVLRRAERVGDQVQQKALLTISAEKGWREVETSYMARHPQVASNLAKLRDFQAGLNDPQERIFSPFRALRSAELPAAGIDRLAEKGDAIVKQAAALAASTAADPDGRFSGGASLEHAHSDL